MTRLRTQDHGGICEVFFNDQKLLSEKQIGEIGDEFKELADMHGCYLFLNFIGVAFISSALIGKLVLLNSWVSKIRRRRLVVCHVPSQALEVFAITKLNRVLHIFKDERAALAQLQSEVAAATQ